MIDISGTTTAAAPEEQHHAMRGHEAERRAARVRHGPRLTLRWRVGADGRLAARWQQGTAVSAQQEEHRVA
jgi:hypothetical protein